MRGKIFILMQSFILLSLFSANSIYSDEIKFLKDKYPGGFSIKEPLKLYSPKDLYEYIDGQAVFYLGYGFKNLEHGFYSKDDATYYVDVYELGSTLSALGAYRQQREEGSEDLGIGCEGALADYLAVFFRGKYYVEIIPMTSGKSDKEDLRILATNVAQNIPPSDGIPVELSLLSAAELVPGSERYVDENLISYSFMGRGLTALYGIGDKQFRVFLSFSETTENAKSLYDTYGKKLENPQTVSLNDLTGLKGKEPYRGTTQIFCWSGYLFGCIDTPDEKQSLDILGKIYSNLISYSKK